MKYTNQTEALNAALDVAPGVEYDSDRSERAGYPIYRNPETGTYICSLGDRYEVNTPDGKSQNFWFDRSIRQEVAA